jgi:ubiquinone/menaquinone biosynthesis C-methylase UbiE
VGVDFSAAMLRRAQRKVSQTEKVEFKQADLMHPLPYATRSFDSAAVVNVLHSLPDPRPALREIARVVKRNGRVVITTPLPTAKPIHVFHAHLHTMQEMRDWLSTMLIIPALFWVLLCNLFMLPRSHFFTPDELTKLLAEQGFRVGQISQTYADQNNLVVAEVT